MFKRQREHSSPSEVKQAEKISRVKSPQDSKQESTILSPMTCASTCDSNMSQTDTNPLFGNIENEETVFDEENIVKTLDFDAVIAKCPGEFPPWGKLLGEVLLQSQNEQTKIFRRELKSVNTSITLIQSQAVDAVKKSKENEESIKNVKSSCEVLKNENVWLRKKLTELESQSRRSNLRFYGVTYSPTENLRDWFRRFSTEVLNIYADIEIERIHRVGTSKYILMKFLRFTDREQVWQNRKNLRDTGIRMAEDFPVEIDRKRAKLFPVMKAAQRQGMKANMAVDRLYIDNNLYTVENLKDLPDCLKLEKISQVTDGEFTFFFGRNSFLSNFCDAPFILDGNKFNRSEQFIQFSKAMLFKDTHTAKLTLAAGTPEEQKALGRKVANFKKDEWNTMALGLLQRGIVQKFDQNAEMKKVLLETGDTEIVECNAKDSLFGIGLGMSNPEKSDRSKWKGKNLMGQLLKNARDQLK